MLDTCLPPQHAEHIPATLLRRFVLSQECDHPCLGETAFYPKALPAALAAMPALLELEFHGIGFMSEALERELSAAPQPAFAGLTSLTLYGDEDAVCSKRGPALYLWLGWVLPAATQLRRLCLSCDFSYAGDFPFLPGRPCLHPAGYNNGPLLSCSTPLLPCSFETSLRLRCGCRSRSM